MGRKVEKIDGARLGSSFGSGDDRWGKLKAAGQKNLAGMDEFLQQQNMTQEEFKQHMERAKEIVRNKGFGALILEQMKREEEE